MKYIYIDTNAISDFKTFSEDDWLLFDKIKCKYNCPYSHAHLFDLNNSPEQYKEEDLKLLEKISSGLFFNKFLSTGEVEIVPTGMDILDVFQKIIDTKNQDDTLYKKDTFNVSMGHQIELDIEKLEKNKNSLLTKIARENNYILNSEFLRLLLTVVSESIDSHKCYKLFRKQVQEIIGHMKGYGTNKIISPEIISFFEIFSKELNDDELFARINKCLIWADQCNGNNFNTKAKQEKILSIYNLLDLVPEYSEDINKKNTVKNMHNDAMHCANAYQSNYFITSDKANRARAAFIKKHFKLNYTILSNIRELLNKFN